MSRKTLGLLVLCSNTFHTHTFLLLYTGFFRVFHLGFVSLSMSLSLFVPVHWQAKICHCLGEGTRLTPFLPAGPCIFYFLTLFINFFHCGIYKILSIPCYNRHYTHFHKTFSQYLSETQSNGKAWMIYVYITMIQPKDILTMWCFFHITHFLRTLAEQSL